MKTTKPIHVPPSPDLATLNLSEDLRMVVEFFARSSGTPPGTVLAAVATTLLALRSRRVYVTWGEPHERPVLSFFLLSSLPMGRLPWLRILHSVIPDCAVKPEPKNPTAWKVRQAFAPSKKDNVIAKIRGGAMPADAGWPEIVEDHDEFTASRVLGLSLSELHKSFGVDFTPLVMELDEWAFAQIVRAPYRSPIKDMIFGFETDIWRAAKCSFFLKVNRKFLADDARSQGSSFFWPTILPECGGDFGTPAVALPDAEAAWIRLLQEASATWNQPARKLVQSNAGSKLANEFRTFVDSIRQYHVYPERYVLAERSFFGFAVWHHLTHGTGDEIGEQSWAAALQFSKWALSAHTQCANSIAGASACPVHSTDAKRLEDLLREKPGTKLRVIQRSFPKRPRGYWQELLKIIKSRIIPIKPVTSGGGDPTSPTSPTSDLREMLRKGAFA